jgi:hypothetical protein
MAFPLLVASFTMGLQCLAKGGTIIIKLFDIYSNATQDLFLGTAKLFERFTLYKPATSRPCNSERYFIAINYVGETDDNATKWIKHLHIVSEAHDSAPITRLFAEPWPKNIMEAIQEHIQYQERQQISVIEETLNFDKSTLVKQITRNIRISKLWCQAFQVPYFI